MLFSSQSIQDDEYARSIAHDINALNIPHPKKKSFNILTSALSVPNSAA
jgi:hypothetical protein